MRHALLAAVLTNLASGAAPEREADIWTMNDRQLGAFETTHFAGAFLALQWI